MRTTPPGGPGSRSLVFRQLREAVVAAPAWLRCARSPLAMPLVVLPTVSLDVPSTDSAVLDHAPAGTARALSANVTADATV